MKKFVIFSSILKNGTPKKIPDISGNGNPKKVSYISGKWNFSPQA